MELNGKKFQVMRGESFDPRGAVGRRQVHFVAMDPETDDAVGMVTHYDGSWRDVPPKVRGDGPTQMRLFSWRPDEVEHFFVHPDLQRQGVGSTLLNHLVEEHWKDEGRSVGSVPTPSLRPMSPASASIVEKLAGKPDTGVYWTDKNFIWDPEPGEYPDAESEAADRAKHLDEHRQREMDKTARKALHEAGRHVRTGWFGAYSPAPEPTTTLAEKLAAVEARDNSPEEGPAPSGAYQMRLPGTYARPLP